VRRMEEGVPPEGQQQYTVVKIGVLRDKKENGKKIGQIKKGAEIVTLEEDGKRVRITNVKTNETGWVSKTNTKGEAVLEPVGGDGAAPTPSGAGLAGAMANLDKKEAREKLEADGIRSGSDKASRKEAKKAELRAKREAGKKQGGSKGGDGGGAAPPEGQRQYTAAKIGIMRDTPKDGSKKVGQIRKNEKIVAIAEDGNFVRITNVRTNIVGWVSKTNTKGEAVLVPVGGDAEDAPAEQEVPTPSAAEPAAAIRAPVQSSEARRDQGQKGEG